MRNINRCFGAVTVQIIDCTRFVCWFMSVWTGRVDLGPQAMTSNTVHVIDCTRLVCWFMSVRTGRYVLHQPERILTVYCHERKD